MAGGTLLTLSEGSGVGLHQWSHWSRPGGVGKEVEVGIIIHVYVV